VGQSNRFNPADCGLTPWRFGEANQFVVDRFDSLGNFFSLMRSPREARSFLASFSGGQVATMGTRHE